MLKQKWIEILKDVKTIYTLKISSDRFRLFYAKDGEIYEIHPYSTNKKDLPSGYTITKDDKRFWFARGGNYDKSASTVENLEQWLGLEEGHFKERHLI